MLLYGACAKLLSKPPVMPALSSATGKRQLEHAANATSKPPITNSRDPRPRFSDDVVSLIVMGATYICCSGYRINT
jgi:hypothetical protein